MKIKTAIKKGKRKSQFGKAMLFCLPWLIGFAVLTFYPLIQTLIFSFNNVRITADGIKMEGVGWQNFFTVLFEDDTFTDVLFQYIGEICVYVPVIIVVSLILAMLLNSKVKGTGLFRTIFFLPIIIVSGPVINQFLSQGVASFSGATSIIDFTELAKVLPPFLLSPLQFLTNSFIMILWFSGIQILVFLTGLQKLDKSMYEAAKIDGANSWELFWKITLPSLNPMIVINVIFTIVMQSVFALNPIISKIQTDMYVSGLGFGYASAMAWIYFIVLIVLIAVFVGLFITKKKRVK